MALLLKWSTQDFSGTHMGTIGGKRGSWPPFSFEVMFKNSTGWVCLCVGCMRRLTSLRVSFQEAPLVSRKLSELLKPLTWEVWLHTACTRYAEGFRVPSEECWCSHTSSWIALTLWPEESLPFNNSLASFFRLVCYVSCSRCWNRTEEFFQRHWQEGFIWSLNMKNRWWRS